MDLWLSDYGGASTTPSPVNRMMASFAGDFRDGVDINLGVGYVNEDTIPRDLVLRATEKVLADPVTYRAALNYGGPGGSDNLTKAIRRFLLDGKVGGLQAEHLEGRQIIIGPNGATSLLESLACVLHPGIVITSDPVYYIYGNYLERRGYRVVAVPEDDRGLRVDLLEQKLEELAEEYEQISFVYVTSVGNPTGTVLSNERREALVDVVTGLSRLLDRCVPAVFDRAYEDLVHDPGVEALQSPILWDEDGVVLEIGTLSKMLAPALRVGYLIGREGRLMDALIQRTSDAGFSAPLINQEIASYMLDRHATDQIRRVNAGYREKAEAVRDCLEGELSGFLAGWTGGSAGFYYYLTFREVDTTEGSDFYRFLSRSTGDATIDGPSESRNPRVVYVPGEYCVHPQGDLVAQGRRQLRISYGFEPTERLQEALSLMRRAAEYASGKPGGKTSDG